MNVLRNVERLRGPSPARVLVEAAQLPSDQSSVSSLTQSMRRASLASADAINMVPMYVLQWFIVELV